jgi:hypothetical protein
MAAQADDAVFDRNADICGIDAELEPERVKYARLQFHVFRGPPHKLLLAIVASSLI